MAPRTYQHHPHQHPCLLGLEFTWTGKPNRDTEIERAVLCAAIDLQTGYPSEPGLAADLALAEQVTGRPADPAYGVGDGRALFVPVSRQEADACWRIVDEAYDYWHANNYQDSEDPFDRALGSLAEHGSPLAPCAR